MLPKKPINNSALIRIHLQCLSNHQNGIPNVQGLSRRQSFGQLVLVYRAEYKALEVLGRHAVIGIPGEEFAEAIWLLPGRRWRL